MRSGVWISREGILLVGFLLLKFKCRISLSNISNFIIEYRISNVTAFSCRQGYFSKTLRLWKLIFFTWIKKACTQALKVLSGSFLGGKEREGPVKMGCIYLF